MPKAAHSHEPKEMIRLSVSEAARLFGVSTLTIRRAIRDQEVTYVVVNGRYKLNFENLVKWSQCHVTIRNKLAHRGIGQFVDQWKIKNPLFSPNPKSLRRGPARKKISGQISGQAVAPATAEIKTKTETKTAKRSAAAPSAPAEPAAPSV